MKGKRASDPTRPGRSAWPNLAVEAGAGCGKTTFLVGRVVEGLASGRFRMGGLAVITFTRKAADELKGRIAAELLKAAGKDPAAGRHLAEIGSARIETIHAFCAALLKERPVEANCDPSFRLLDEEEGAAFLESFFDGWIADRLERHPEFFERMIRDRALTLKRRETGHGAKALAFYDLLETAVKYRELDLFEPGKPESPAAIRRAWTGECRSFMERAASPKLRDRIGECLALVSALGEGATDGAMEAVRKAGLMRTTGGDADAELRGEWKPAFEARLAEFDYARRFPGIAALYRACRELARDFVAGYRERLRAEGVMDFHEVLNGLVALLRDGGPEVRGYFKRRFDALFVDEFQDTDPLQAEMLFYLGESPDAHAAGWREPGFRLAEGKLCVVGDPKQSIYRFRRADIAVYQEAAGRIAAAGERRTLSDNHRSGPALLAWVNELFAGAMNRGEPGERPTQAVYVPLRAADRNRNLPGAVRFVECADEPEPGKEDGSRKAGEIRDIEARMTARWIADHAVERGREKPGRSFARGDLLVLFRKKVSLRLAAEYLDELGVPYEIHAEGDFFDRPEIVDAMNLLRALANPADEVSLAATLLGPFCALTDARLREWKAGGNRLAIPSEATGAAHPVADALESLRILREASRRLSAAETLERALAGRGLYASYDATFRGRGRVANLVRLIEWLKRFAGKSLAETVRLVSDAAGREIEPPAVSLRSGTVDAVRLMTVHKAKGLEAPVVYLADGNAAEPPENLVYPGVLRGTEGAAIVCKLGSGKAYATAESEAAKEEDALRSEEEEMRLRYVAATRAKQLFLVNRLRSGAREGAFASPFHRLDGTDAPFPVEIEAVVLHAGARAVALGACAPPEPLVAELDAVNARGEEIRRLLEAGTAVVSPSHAKKPGRESAMEGDDEPEGAAPPPAGAAGPGARLLSGRDPAGEPEFTGDLQVTYDPDAGSWSAVDLPAATRGILAHKLLELDPDDLDRAAKALLAGGPAETQAGPLAALVRKMRDRHGLRDRVRRARRVMREVPLRFTAADGTHIDGTIDLLFEEAGGWVLVDWKTAAIDDADSADRLAGKYEAQMATYAAGLAQLGIRVKEKILVGG